MLNNNERGRGKTLIRPAPAFVCLCKWLPGFIPRLRHPRMWDTQGGTPAPRPRTSRMIPLQSVIVDCVAAQEYIKDLLTDDRFSPFRVLPISFCSLTLPHSPHQRRIPTMLAFKSTAVLYAMMSMTAVFVGAFPAASSLAISRRQVDSVASTRPTTGPWHSGKAIFSNFSEGNNAKTGW
jgi:hypothetical protein